MRKTETERMLRVDPITFEILRHRFWAINNEAASTVRLVSGSSVATEANDMNTALMDAAGETVAIGYYSLAKASTLSNVVKEVLREYQENPGIRPGDAFLCNDPYVGVQHQNDVALVKPVFVDGVLLAWAGAEIHQVDVGGPVTGQVQVGAKDIFGEQPLIPPIKILEGGVLRKDLERLYLRHSRLPDLVGLDLRAKLAACNVTEERLIGLCRKYGMETVRDALQDLLDYVEARLAQRLAAIPDGVWRYRTYMDYGDALYTLQIALEKRGTRLTVDFHGTSPQAPAIINCTYGTTVAITRGYLTSLLCWDIPWSPSAVGRLVDVRTEEGTIVHARWPAGVSKATTSTGWNVGKSLTVLVGKMLLSSPDLRQHAMASWQGAKTVEELFGQDQRGRYFGGTLLDGMAGGGGARTFRDGIDTGGYAGSMQVAIANVESYEFEYPILYLFRRHAQNTGGAGRFRGGTGISMGYVVHGAEEIPEKVMHTVGALVPLSSGIGGGYPSGTNQFYIKRDTEVWREMADGRMPDRPEALGGQLEVFGPIAHTRQGRDDVYWCVNMGGGGLGDPLERDPALVLADIRRGLVDVRFAREMYGVAVRDDQVDEVATAELRAQARQARRRLGKAQRPFSHPPLPPGAEVEAELTPDIRVARGVLFCRCGAALAPSGPDWKEYVPRATFPLSRIGPQADPYGLSQGQFEVREVYCPACQRLLDVDVARPEDPWLADVLLVPEGGA